MIIYAHKQLFGWRLIFHVTGSAAFSAQALLPALFSAALAALFSNYEPIQTYFSQRVRDVIAIFAGFQFLISLCLVMRARLATMRFRNAHETYGRFSFALLRLAVIFTSTMDRCANLEKLPEEMLHFRTTFLRWLRAVHVLALEEYRGFESPKYRLGLLLFTEEIILFKENRRAARVLRWMIRGYHKHLGLLAPGFGADSRMRNLLDEIYTQYNLGIFQANQLFFFPFGQCALVCVAFYALWAPIAFSVMMPHTNALGALVCFFSVWITFAFNETGKRLEWPFNGRENDLPLAHFSMQFMEEVGEAEFGRDATLLDLNWNSVIGRCGTELDLPEPDNDARFALEKEEDKWVRRNLDELVREGNGQQRALVDIFQPDRPSSISNIRAAGEFKVLL